MQTDVVEYPQIKTNSFLLRILRRLLLVSRGKGFFLKQLILGFPSLNNSHLVLNNDELWLDLKNDSDIGYFYFEGIRHEKFIQTLLQSVVDLETVFYDVGANIGYYPLVLHSKVKKIYAFEPNPILAGRIEKFINVNKIDNIQLVGSGVSDIVQRMNFYFNRNRHDLGSFIKSDSNTEKYEVDILTLTDCIEKRSFQLPDVIKIDTEGFELNVLRGLAKYIHSLPIIFMEWNVQSDEVDIMYAQLVDIIGDPYIIYRICTDNRLVHYAMHDDHFMGYLALMPKDNHKNVMWKRWVHSVNNPKL